MSANCYEIDLVSGKLIKSGCNSSSGSGVDELFFNRDGKVKDGTWLLFNEKPSSVRGKLTSVNSIITGLNVTVKVNSSFDLEVHSHEGNLTNSQLLVTEVFNNIIQQSKTLNINIPTGKQIALRLTNGSTRNVLVGVLLDSNG